MELRKNPCQAGRVRASGDQSCEYRDHETGSTVLSGKRTTTVSWSWLTMLFPTVVFWSQIFSRWMVPGFGFFKEWQFLTRSWLEPSRANREIGTLLVLETQSIWCWNPHSSSTGTSLSYISPLFLSPELRSTLVTFFSILVRFWDFWKKSLLMICTRSPMLYPRSTLTNS